MIVFSIFLCFIGLSTYFLVTTAITQGTQFVENIPQYINDINRAWLGFQYSLEENYENLPPELVSEINAEVTRMLNDIRSNISNTNFIARTASIVSNIPGYLVSFLVYLIALFLFMLEMPSLKTKLFAYLSDKTKERVNFMANRLSYVVFGFLKASFCQHHYFCRFTYRLALYCSRSGPYYVSHYLGDRLHSYYRFYRYSRAVGHLPIHGWKRFSRNAASAPSSDFTRH